MMKLYSNRTGIIYHVQSDYDGFVPTSLDKVVLKYDNEMVSLISEANNLIGMMKSRVYINTVICTTYLKPR